MDVAFGTVILALLVGVPAGIAKWRRWEGRKALDAILARFDGELISYKDLRCRKHGQEVTFHRDRKADVTSIEIPVPARYPLAIEIRRRTLGSILLPDGVPELKLGDHQFDRAFAVVGAPAAIVEQLLGVEVRSFLLEHRECIINVKDGRLDVTGLGIVSTGVALEAIHVATSIVAGIRDAFATLAEQAESIGLADGPSPYRPVAVEGPDLARAHEDEVANLQRLRRRAMWKGELRALALIVLCVGVLAVVHLLRR